MYFFKKTTNKHTEENTDKNLFINVTGDHKHKQDCSVYLTLQRKSDYPPAFTFYILTTKKKKNCRFDYGEHLNRQMGQFLHTCRCLMEHSIDIIKRSQIFTYTYLIM